MGAVARVLRWKLSWAVVYLACCSHAESDIEVPSLDLAARDMMDCPCSNASWCNPITDIPQREVFAFSLRNDDSHWKLFDWSKLTTVVMFGYLNDSLMCLAHSYNVRVVMLGNVNEKTFTDPTLRKKWILQQLIIVKNHFLDGINFDFENAVAADDKEVRDAYTALVRETKEHFKQDLPYSQVSVDVAWKPNVDIRYYDYAGLADGSDFLFVMAYDEQSQIFGECVAGPNSALGTANEGLSAYLNGYNHTIKPDKLVLGVPWYGYLYRCVSTERDKCYIKEIPFRGVNCSDAAGKQYDYSILHILIDSMPESYRWNTSSSTPYLIFLGGSMLNITYQIQYDDPVSLKMKYNLAEKLGLRGVGMWNIDSLDYTETTTGQLIRKSMFDILPSRSILKNGNTEQGDKTSATEKSNAPCPCANPKLCEPVKNMTRKEIFAFSLSNDESHWLKYDWSKVTTVVQFQSVNESLMCLAHAHNVRVVFNANIDIGTFTNPAERAEWVKKQVQYAKNNFLDGINFDYEGTIKSNQTQLSEGYADLVNETSIAFKKELPYSQISVDVDINSLSSFRSYNYKRLAEASDFLFLMAYDECGSRRAGSNSALGEAKWGIGTYAMKDIGPEKLVLGLPWYGYTYECAKLVNDTCILNSTSRVSQLSYSAIYHLLQTIPNTYRWNDRTQTPFFSFTNNKTGQVYQIQYDNPKSLKLKYDLAAREGLRGVGMWTIDSLDYSDTGTGEKMREPMFAALPTRTDLLKSSSLTFVPESSLATLGDNLSPGNKEKTEPATPYIPDLSNCPCSDPKLCEPIKDTKRKEVYAFSINNDETHWKSIDWTKVTTVCMFKYVNTSLMCQAHSHNARAVVLGEVKLFTMITPALRKQWIQTQLQIVKDNFLDGLNFDVEMGISPEQKELREAYAALVTETSEAFKKELPYSQISVDVKFDANSNATAYDYPKLAAAADFLFIMSYDDSGYSSVGPNSGYQLNIYSIHSYFDKGIGPEKLVLGLPWYGYIYNCVQLEGDQCILNASLPPHAHQSEQYSYYNIYKIMHTIPGKYARNKTSLTPYFSYTDPVTQKIHQIQYDDPESLTLKYKLAAQYNLRGVGMWTIDFLDFSDTSEGEQMRHSMYDPLPSRPNTTSPEPRPESEALPGPAVNGHRTTAACPCGDPKLCEPIKTTGRKEVFAFSIVNNATHWEKFDWSKITTMCMFEYVNVSLTCLAHSHNVRAVSLGAVDVPTMTSPLKRKDWISQQLQIARENFLDGVNFDFEGHIYPDQETLRNDFIALIDETSQAFKEENPYSQISVDVIFTPNGAGRYYGYQRLAQVVDFFFIMAYDEGPAISGRAVAGPNAGYCKTQAGIENYLHQTNVSADKLVLGLPWYGKIYGCMGTVGGLCVLDQNQVSSKPHTLRELAAGTDVKYIYYDAVYDLLQKQPDSYHWNDTSSSPYVIFRNSTNGNLYEIQFDDPRSLKLKYKLADSMYLRGVGIWTIDYLDYTASPSSEKMRREMFDALP